MQNESTRKLTFVFIIYIIISSSQLFGQEEIAFKLHNARSSYSQQNYIEAIEIASSITEQGDLQKEILTQAYTILGACYADIGSPTMSANAFQKALEIYPQVYFDNAFFSQTAVAIFTKKHSELIWVIHINSDPQDALVTVNNEKFGKTPVQLVLLKINNYSIFVEKESYKQSVIKIGPSEQITSKQDSLFVTLEKYQGSLVVNSNPQTAEIILDGKLIGITPDTLASLKYGTYKIQLRKQDFNTIENSVQIDSAMNFFHIDMAKATGFFYLRHYPPIAEVIVDDTLTFSSQGSAIIEQLCPGPHIYKIRKKGFKEFIGGFDVSFQDTVILPPIRLERFSRLNTIFLSLFWPGGGQYYTRRWINGSLYSIAEFSLAALAMDKYLASYDASESYKRKLRTDGNRFIFGLAGIHILGIFDSGVFGFPNPSNIHTSSNIKENNGKKNDPTKQNDN